VERKGGHRTNHKLNAHLPLALWRKKARIVLGHAQEEAQLREVHDIAAGHNRVQLPQLLLRHHGHELGQLIVQPLH
jgi:hypothetical protein